MAWSNQFPMPGQEKIDSTIITFVIIAVICMAKIGKMGSKALRSPCLRNICAGLRPLDCAAIIKGWRMTLPSISGATFRSPGFPPIRQCATGQNTTWPTGGTQTNGPPVPSRTLPSTTTWSSGCHLGNFVCQPLNDKYMHNTVKKLT